MKFFRRLRCMTGRHVPDRGQARHDRDYWWTTCKQCGATLMRDPVGGWRVPTEQELDAHEKLVQRHGADRPASAEKAE